MKNEKNGRASSLAEAEMNARKRDLEVEKEKFKEDHRGVDQEELTVAMETLSKATGKDIFIGTKRSVKSKVKFSQFIQDNWNYALDNDFFTTEEILFLVKIQRFMQFKSNCIVDDIHSRNSIPMTQKQIAERLGTSSSTVSKIVNNLVDKGIIVKAKGNLVKGNNVRTYALFVNPNIIYSGERDNVETTLKALFMNSKPIFKKFPVTLF